MVMVLINSVRRWWSGGAGARMGRPMSLSPAGLALTERRAIAPRRVVLQAPAVARRLPSKPLTPFGAAPRARASARSPLEPAQRFWMTVDPQDRRHAALGGSFAQVCAALEQLAALEERRL